MSAPRRLRNRLRLQKPVGISRRDFLKRAGGLAGLTAALPLLQACGDSSGRALVAVQSPAPGVNPAPTPAPVAKSTPFLHGVASGDPMPEAVILWTRATPVATEAIAVTVNVYRDTALTQRVGSMSQMATSARDWTIKIDFTGLSPATTYYYQFEAVGFKSLVARTRTAPAANADNTRLRLGLVSCSSYAHGFFNAYRFLAARADIDVVLHLGDYIYEYASDAASGDEVYGTARPYEPTYEMKSLADYRMRHSYYKRTDPDLVELHRQHPFVTIWDDHESTDNSWRDAANNHNEDGKNEGVWATRKGFAQQAYDEWMPIRLPEPGNTNRIWRRYRYGNLAELFMTDSRLYDRDVQLSTPIQPQEPRNAADRKLLGPEQRDWLLDGLGNTSSTWKLVGNQVVFHQWSVQAGLKSAGGPMGLNGDSWDAYGAERQSIIDGLRSKSIDNVVILTGDVHTSWVADITDDPNNTAAYRPDPATAEPRTYTGSVAVEYVVTSVTSPGALPDLQGGEDGFAAINPHIKRINLADKGYSILDVTPERVVCEYWYVSTIAMRGGTEAFAYAYPTPVGENRIRAVLTAPTTAPASPPPLAP